MPQVLNIKHNRLILTRRDVVYIGRPSKWGNPFVIGKDGTREEVIAKFKNYIFHLTEWHAPVVASK